MKHKQYKKSERQPERPSSRVVSLSSLQLSGDAFYGTFLSLAFVVAILLSGANMRVANMHIVFPDKSPRQALFESRIHKLVTGYPIEAMTPYIEEQNQTTATYLVSIAKKESNWGKRVPRAEDGTDCYNYWGYRGAGSRGIAMGHGCFGSPEEAVGIVGGRLDTLVNEYQFRTPAEMVVWKCGFSCDGHSNQSVKKWITDVGHYYNKLQ
jgi:hypothetical protein